MGLKILAAVNDLGREEQGPGDTAAFDLEREGLDPGDVMMTRFHGPSLTQPLRHVRNGPWSAVEEV